MRNVEGVTDMRRPHPWSFPIVTPDSKSFSEDVYVAQVRIIEVRSGKAAVGELLTVRFVQPDYKYPKRYVYPFTPSQRAQEYVIVSYADWNDGIRRLAPFPISPSEYRKWQSERDSEFFKRR